MGNIIKCECFGDLYDSLFDLSENMGRPEARINFLSRCLLTERVVDYGYYFGFMADDINDICDPSEIRVKATLNKDMLECKIIYYVNFNDGYPTIEQISPMN